MISKLLKAMGKKVHSKRLVFLGLGSNLGDRLSNMRRAVRMLSSCGAVILRSGVYSSVAIGPGPQPDFLNAAIGIEVSRTLHPLALLRTIKKIERAIGRPVLYDRWTARKIDIDVLLWGRAIFKARELTIPHKDMQQRPFVILPLSDIIGSFAGYPLMLNNLGPRYYDQSDIWRTSFSL